MTEALSDIFAAAQAPQINWNGKPAYAIYEIEPAPDEVIVEFLSAIESPVQGITLKVAGGVLEINGLEATEMVLWNDTAPEKVVARVKCDRRRAAVLKIWNVWRGSMGGIDVTQAWLGNSGMRINRILDDKELHLRCSDGEGPVNFEDLKIRVKFA